LVPIESANATLVLSCCIVSDILHVFVLLSPDPAPIALYFGGVSVGSDRPCWGQSEHKP